MNYRLESDMIPALARALPPLLAHDAPYVVGFEVPDGSRVVDVMYAVLPHRLGHEPDADGFPAKLARLSVAQAVVLAVIWRERKVSEARLSRLTYISRERLTSEYLARLEASGLVTQSNRSWTVTSWANAQPPVIIAVEAKLRDWREAIAQAHDNRVRSDHSFIAIPRLDDKAKASEILAHARGRGVGVIELDPDGGATISVRARRVPEREAHKKWELAVKLLARLQSIALPVVPPSTFASPSK